MTSAPSPQPPRSLYRELPPPPALASRLVCAWTQAIGAGDGIYRQRVLPDACIDIVCIGEAAPLVVGPATRAVVAPLPPRTRVLGLRLRPGLAPGLIGVPADALMDREIPLAEAWGGAAAALHAAAQAAAPEQALAAMALALARRLPQAGAPDPLVLAVVDRLAGRPQARVEHLCREAGVSARQMRRRFAAAVGYGPKTFQRVLRFQRALALAAATRPGPPNLAAVAHAAGYADQAHMTREVVRLSGRPPSVLLPHAESTLAMAGFFKTAEAAAD